MQRTRLLAPLAIVAVAALLSGCAAGSPTTIAPPVESTAPAVAQAPLAPTEAPTALPPTAPPPTVPPPPASPTSAPAVAQEIASAASADDATPAAATGVGGGDVGAVAQTGAAPAGQIQPTPRPPAPPDPGDGISHIVEGGPNDQKEVALTFDAGADAGYTSQILDFLQDQGIKATFGMTGQFAQANPDLVKRMVADGHQLINHTWDHASLTGANTGLAPMTPDQVTQELTSTADFVRNLTGYEMKPYFRPPYGDYDDTSLRELYDNGYYLTIWWTCDTRGWAGWTADKIVGYCTTNIKSHEIILMHVGAAAAGDFDALPGLVDFFRAQGYQFVTVEQMVQP
ncbi:MAG TPA: polysaccharide deacetylase family protein [Thermomicrobiales bacterium]|nr:polysaccharide deacetylase family protein [Thermomicrobiales bacterium]